MLLKNFSPDDNNNELEGKNLEGFFVDAIGPKKCPEKKRLLLVLVNSNILHNVKLFLNH